MSVGAYTHSRATHAASLRTTHEALRWLVFLPSIPAFVCLCRDFFLFSVLRAVFFLNPLNMHMTNDERFGFFARWFACFCTCTRMRCWLGMF